MTRQKCCPECGSLDVQALVYPWADDRSERPAYRCDRCCAHFDAPERREPDADVRSRGNISDIGRALIEADPEEVDG